ncbi:MAG: Ig-like domain-containing protein [Anaerolineae bacterium]|nr:Ig-like domain-containing protein [Anaerolineae bacterium]
MTSHLNLTLIFFLSLFVACGVPQTMNVQGAQIQNGSDAGVANLAPNAQTTATPAATGTLTATQGVSTTTMFPSIANAPLQVISTSPAADAQEIAVDRQATRIIVQFNHPVVPLVSVSEQAGLPQPLTISPALAGSGIWINTSTYSFTPSQDLGVATEYTVNVAEMTDMLGSTLDGYAWKFKTASPQVKLTYPEAGTQNAGASEPISMTFNTEMDRASVESRFTLVSTSDGANVPGTFEWNATVAKFVPNTPLDYDAQYRATLKAGAQDINQQAATLQDVVWQYRTSRKPGVLSTVPKDGDQSSIAIRNGFQITYASPMAQDGVTVTIQPTITNQYSYWNDSTQQTIAGGWLASEAYTVTISGESETVFGDKLGEDVVVKFVAAPLDPEVYLNVTGTTGLYDSNAPQLIYTTFVNVPSIEYGLYNVPRADLLRLVGADRYQYWDNYKPDSNNLIRSWSQDVSAPLNASRVISTSLGGDTPSTYLKPGAYYLEARPPAELKSASRSRHMLIVTPYNLALKRNETEALVWATNLADGKPAADLPITIYGANGQAAASGKTDKDGVFRGAFPRQEYYEPIFAMSQENTDLLAAVGSDWAEGIQTYDFNLSTQYGAQEYYANMYTDRAIYRPGQVVYFRGILRRDNDASYTLPTDLKTVPIKVSDANGREILNQELPLGPYGTFDGKIDLNKGASLGFYTIILEFGPENRRFYNSIDFQVAEYKAPEFQVEVTTDKPSYVNGETIRVKSNTAFFFGGAVSDADVQWRLLSDDLFFSTDKVEGYWDFSDYDLTADRRPSGGVIREGKGKTDAQGNFDFAIPADVRDFALSQNLTIDVEVTDINNAVVASRVVVPVHKGDFYIGLRPQSYVGQVMEPQGVDIITVSPEGNPFPNVPVTISVYEHKWFSVRERDTDGNFYWKSSYTDTLQATIDVTTDISGTASAFYTPTVGGVFKIVGQAQDENDNAIRSATYQWVATDQFVNWRIENNDRIELVADKKEYSVGDTAKVLIPAPFANAQALMTIERGGILEVKPLGVIGNSDTLEIPITEELLPTAYVSVMLVKGRTEDSPTPQFKLGYATLNINPEGKILAVKITPDEAPNENGIAQYEPGDNVIFTVEATDAGGNPAQTEFSVALVDKAVQALADDRSVSLENAFWGTRGIGVQTAASWVRSVERINQNVQAQAKGGGGGGGREQASPVRRNFQDTAYWRADLVTDANGIASVTIPLPDNLTTWNLTAKGVTKETLVGTGKLDILSTKPVLVRPVVPRFFVPGDQVLIQAVVNNNTDKAVTVDVNLTATGITLSGSATQPLTVPANNRAKVTWETSVDTDAQAVRVKFSAEGDGYSDALEATLPVVRATSPEVVGASGTVDASVAEQIQVPANADPTAGGLRITTSPSLAAVSLESLKFLQAYPYECSEQVVSKFYPNIVTYQALKKFNVENEELESDLAINISKQIQQLYQLQHGDGGWGLWANDNSMPHTTAYALLALDTANRQGFSVDEYVMQRARDYLTQYLDQPVNATEPYAYNERAFVIYAMQEVTGEYGARALNLYERRTQLDNFAKSLLMVALFDSDNKTQAAALAQELTAAAIPSAAGTQWQEKQPDWYMMNTDTRTTAIVLYGLARVDPQNALLQNAVRWLTTMRQQGHWETTQETAWSVLGLTEYMTASGELDADYSYQVALNDAPLAQTTVTKETVADNQQLDVAIKDLLIDTANELLFTRTQGPGNLYYSAFLNYYLPASEIQALDHGVLVARQYLAVDQATLNPTNEAITSAQVGDYVQVKLTVIAPINLHYLLVEDPLPSGFEAVDTSLKTTSAGAAAPELEKQISDCTACSEYYHPFWYYWSNTELRDDRVALFANYLSRGTYEYTYLIRASVGGEFTALPTFAQQMYEPGVFGRSAASEFTVTGE